jgi:hypothetical protein
MKYLTVTSLQDKEMMRTKNDLTNQAGSILMESTLLAVHIQIIKKGFLQNYLSRKLA